ncbi:MAG: hypothetical protein ACK43K_16105, partial [Chitinophagales bacterium]
VSVVFLRLKIRLFHNFILISLTTFYFKIPKFPLPVGQKGLCSSGIKFTLCTLSFLRTWTDRSVDIQESNQNFWQKMDKYNIELKIVPHV